ncbi:MAG TPA: metallophosphoesterase, partial [Gemmatimonadaceae bacterium]|nr:metallophosphoesterase [Gemmatimonadaceae bacterium]
GDLVDDRAEDVARYADALGGLEKTSRVFVIAGNHDVYAGWAAVERGLNERSLGTVLVNDAVVVQQGGASLAIVGVGDPAGRARMWAKDDGSDVAPDVARAMSRVPPGLPVVALAHNPALWPELARAGAALTLSGHTHWGQLAFPGAGWSMATPFLEYSMGAYQENGAVLYIHPGTGYWGIPFRIGALPEVTILTLRAANETAIDVGRARRPV